MGKGGGSETVTTTLDPRTQQYVDWQRNMARGQATSVLDERDPYFLGPSRGQQQALGQLGQITPGAGFEQFMRMSGQAAGQFGQAFDPSSIQSFLDPYIGNVVAGAQGIFGQQRGLAAQSAKQQATSAGAFGGARSALLEAQGVGDVNRQEAQMIPQLLSGGYSQALQAALGQHQFGQQQAGMGMQNLLAGTQFGTGLEFQRGQAQFSGQELFRQLRERQSQEGIFRGQTALGFANQGIGPYGQTQTATQGGGNPLAGAFGGAMAGAQFGPIGGIVGGGLGLLGGLFG